MQRYLFGAKSESLKKEENIIEGEQCSIFGIPEDEKVQKEIAQATETIKYHRKKNSRKITSGIKKSEQENVEIETYIENVDALKCSECGAEMKKTGTEFVRQEIQFIAAKLKLVNYVRIHICGF